MSSKVLEDSAKTLKLFIRLMTSAKFEVLLILPTINAFKREYRIGAFHLLVDLTSKSKSADSQELTSRTIGRFDHGKDKGGVTCRILTPTNDEIEQIIMELRRYNQARSAQQNQQTTLLNDRNENHNKHGLQIRHLDSPPRLNVTTVTILVVDRSSSLVIEKIDDSKMEFVEAAGLATYSTSEPTVISYASIFENFWNQAELHEQLKLHDKMQKEFINIASHELKTPVQSILGYSELLLEHPENFQKLAEGVRRNALRLEKLTNNILDVSRIDSNRLKLRKDVLNINEKIANVVKDLSLNSEIKINIIEPSVNPIVVEADKVRMYQVLSNLLTNAIKFSRIRRNEIPNAGHKAGNDITIYTEVRTSPRHEVVIAVKDRGTGITSDIQDKLFSKFASKSEEGMGLGLFISRGIVEAHNGKIWAENNRDGGGATFAFSLPLDSA